MATVAELEAAKAAVLTAMLALAAGAKSATVGGRTVVHRDLQELREQYKFYEEEIGKANSARRSAVVSFREPGL